MVRKRTNGSEHKGDVENGNGPGPQELTRPDAAPVSEEAGVPSVPVAEGAEAPLATTEEQLAQARQQAKEYLELAQRGRAELINFKRRVEREQEENRLCAIEALIFELLPVMDSFAQAISTYACESDDDNPLLAGLRRTVAQFERVLAKYGVTRIVESGVPFDAELHQPLHTEESGDVSVDTVAEVYQPGVKVGGRIVRPATVRVLVPKAEGDRGEEEREA